MKKFILIVMCIASLLLSVQVSFAQGEYKLGVLSPKGADVTRNEWQPTVEYLSNQTGNKFSLVPLQLKSFKPAVNSGKIDFFLCNSVLFYQIQGENTVKPLASMINMYQGKPLRGHPEGVLFTLANSNINKLSDLQGKKVAALQKNALMGYQYQVYMLKEKGIEVEKDFEVSFAGTLPRVVKAVKSGGADAGFAGAELNQWFKDNAEFNASDFKIIDFESGGSSHQQMFPSWVFGAAQHADDALAKNVVAALKEITEDSFEAKAANIYGWEDPADLTPVKKLLQSVK
jgi:ABC-type phosphate/phosphonate transport system substrate-binding protein